MTIFALKKNGFGSVNRSKNRRHVSGSRSLQAESLEGRLLLAVSVVSDAFQDFDHGVAAINQGNRTDEFFTVVNEIPAASRPEAIVNFEPTRFTALTLDGQAMRNELANAPLEGTVGAMDPLVLNVPAPDGTFSRFAVYESLVMDTELAANFPEIRTYVGQGIDDPTATLRADFTTHGFHAQVLSPNGAWYVDPYWHMDQSAYISYFRADLGVRPESEHWTDDSQIDDAVASALSQGDAGGGPDAIVSRRDVRTAITTTTTYNAFFGNTVAGVLSAVTTAINRITGVYEIDSAIRLVLVPETTFLFSGLTGAGTSNPNPSIAGGSNVQTLANNNQAFTDGQIGSASYDLGHVFHRGSFNGISAGGIGIVGRAGLKARAATSGTPNNDVFYIDYVSHEMGHQFGGRHNFNNCSGSLGDQPQFSNEPASGSTIMGYAGICSINVQPNSDAYFNYLNLNQISAYMNSGLPQGLPTPVVTTNNTPIIDSLSNYNIPDQTPFRLTATGSDPDGDTVSYTWEQADTGNVNPNPSNDPGSGPIIRSRTGSTSGQRLVPPLQNILAGNTFPTGEILPMTTRTLNFRVTARDNHAGSGGVTQSTLQVFSHNTGTGFMVTAPNTAVTWAGGSNQTVTWNVSGSNVAPINTANVRILLSTNGGQQFPIVLAESVPNTGSAQVQMPFDLGTTQARIMVEAVGNIFFDISNTNFTITHVTSDLEPPTAVGDADDIVTGGGLSHVVSVVYTDNTEINASSINDDDIVIQLPDATTVPVTLLSSSSPTNTTPITAEYSVAAPGGFWDPSDNGTYQILAVAGAVTDGALNPIAAGVIGSFEVNVTSLPGDFNGDSLLDCVDVNELSNAIVNGSTDLLYDLNEDSLIDVADLEYWVLNLKQTLMGDANLDFSVDGSDFNVWNSSKFTATTEWCSGNFNADSGVDGSDFSIWNANKFQSARPGAGLPPIGVLREFVASEHWDRTMHAPPPAIRMSETDLTTFDVRPGMTQLPSAAVRLAGTRTEFTSLQKSVQENTQSRDERVWDAIFESWEAAI